MRRFWIMAAIAVASALLFAVGYGCLLDWMNGGPWWVPY